MVVEKEFHNPGKGAAVVRLKLRGLKTGNVTKEVIKTDQEIEEATVEHKPVNFLYKGENFVFVSPFTFEQYEVEPKILAGEEGFIKEGEEYQIAIYEGRVIGVRMPKKIVFEVTEAEDSSRGDTVTGATKPVKLDSGLVVQVPLFIKKGEKILVNTETKEYMGRKN